MAAHLPLCTMGPFTSSAFFLSSSFLFSLVVVCLNVDVVVGFTVDEVFSTTSRLSHSVESAVVVVFTVVVVGRTVVVEGRVVGLVVVFLTGNFRRLVTAAVGRTVVVVVMAFFFFIRGRYLSRLERPPDGCKSALCKAVTGN